MGIRGRGAVWAGALAASAGLKTEDQNGVYLVGFRWGRHPACSRLLAGRRKPNKAEVIA
jgi:hypothetical protein